MKTVNKKVATALAGLFIFGLMSCNSGPQPIQIGSDACSFCKMSIADNRFGGEIITKKGKVYKFDDMHCILGFMKSNEVNKNDIRETWFVNYNEPHNFLAADKSYFLKDGDLHSPMGGNVAVFENENQLNDAMKILNGKSITWNELVNQQ